MPLTFARQCIVYVLYNIYTCYFSQLDFQQITILDCANIKYNHDMEYAFRFFFYFTKAFQVEIPVYFRLEAT